MTDDRPIITWAIVASYLIAVLVAIGVMLFSSRDIQYLEAVLALIAALGVWVGQIVERRNTQVSHERSMNR